MADQKTAINQWLGNMQELDDHLVTMVNGIPRAKKDPKDKEKKDNADAVDAVWKEYQEWMEKLQAVFTGSNDWEEIKAGQQKYFEELAKTLNKLDEGAKGGISEEGKQAAAQIKAMFAEISLDGTGIAIFKDGYKLEKDFEGQPPAQFAEAVKEIRGHLDAVGRQTTVAAPTGEQHRAAFGHEIPLRATALAMDEMPNGLGAFKEEVLFAEEIPNGREAFNGKESEEAIRLAKERAAERERYRKENVPMSFPDKGKPLSHGEENKLFNATQQFNQSIKHAPPQANIPMLETKKVPKPEHQGGMKGEFQPRDPKLAELAGKLQSGGQKNRDPIAEKLQYETTLRLASQAEIKPLVDLVSNVVHSRLPAGQGNDVRPAVALTQEAVDQHETLYRKEFAALQHINAEQARNLLELLNTFREKLTAVYPPSPGNDMANTTKRRFENETMLGVLQRSTGANGRIDAGKMAIALQETSGELEKMAKEMESSYRSVQASPLPGMAHDPAQGGTLDGPDRKAQEKLDAAGVRKLAERYPGLKAGGGFGVSPFVVTQADHDFSAAQRTPVRPGKPNQLG